MPALLSGLAPAPVSASAAAAAAAGGGDQRGGGAAAANARASASVGVEAVLALARRTVGGEVDADAPLMEAGLDSLGAVELRNLLQQAAGDGAALPATLVFDHPTARQLALALAPDGTPTDAAPPPAPAAIVGATAGATLAGVSARLPANFVAGAVWRASAGGHDHQEVPAARWALDVLPAAADVVSRRVRHGGFVAGAERFDGRFFGVSAAEAAAIDPQQRLLLEHGYEALHGAALTRASLLGSATAVFVGIASNDYANVSSVSSSRSVYSATGAGHSIASGRLSFSLGLHGPCVSVDTACSSGLVAHHSALRALQLAECTAAVAAGVNLMLAPHVGIAFATAGMTSARGRCHTFDDRADGYARAEACVALAAVSEAVMKRGGGDRGGAALSLLGSAVRQDGRSASLTAPNGKAQQALLHAALGRGVTAGARG